VTRGASLSLLLGVGAGTVNVLMTGDAARGTEAELANLGALAIHRRRHGNGEPGGEDGGRHHPVASATLDLTMSSFERIGSGLVVRHVEERRLESSLAVALATATALATARKLA